MMAVAQQFWEVLTSRRRLWTQSAFRVDLVAFALLLVHLSGVTARAADETNFTWTGHYRPFWGVDVGIEGAFKATVHAVVQNSLSSAGAWLRHYSVSSVKFELPLSYFAYAVPPEPDPPIPPPIYEDYLVTLESSDFDLSYHSPPIVGFGPGSFVIEAYTPAQGYSLYIFLGHPRRQVFSTPKGSTLIIGGTSQTPPDAFVLTVGSGVPGVYGVGQWPSASEFLFPVGYDWTHLPPAWGIPDWPDNWFAVQCPAFQDDDIWARVSLHRVTADGLDPDEPSNIDDPLEVKPDANILADMPPLERGVVADGVTPVLFKIEAFPLTDTTYSIVFAHRAGSVDLSNKVKVLSGGTFRSGTTVTLSPTVTTAYAYMQGLDRQALTLGPDKEVRVGVTLQTLDEKPVAATSFAIRLPPVVLVHGIGSTANWEFSEPFLNYLYMNYPRDFVLPVEYGVSGANHDDPTGNQTSSLVDCAALLHDVLVESLEQPASPIRSLWAFTRYDIVGHSQGGIILRYLAQPHNLPRVPAFKTADNFWRGRFDRIITIGSPHNGSLNYFYMKALCDYCDASHRPLDKLPARLFDAPGNKKFDPFRAEITTINSDQYATDPAARFNCVQTTIDGGKTPGESTGGLPLVYKGLDEPVRDPLRFRVLYDQLWPDAPKIPPTSVVRRGHFVLPVGSDGVVDFDSQRGGCGVANVTDLRHWGNIAHMIYFYKVNFFPGTQRKDFSYMFGVEKDFSQIDSTIVATHVNSLLRAPKTAFGPFINANTRPLALKQAIIRIITEVGRPALADSIYRTPNTMHFSIQSPSHPPVDGSVVWSAAHYGADRIDLMGVTLEPDLGGSNAVTLSVTPGLIGDIELRAEYRDAAGNTLVATPMRAYRNDGGASLVQVSLAETNLTLPAGGFAPGGIIGNYSDGTSRRLFTVPGDGITYSSSDTNVAALTFNGVIDALNPGSCIVTVGLAGPSGSCSITVVPANDDFLFRQTIPAGRYTGSNQNASKEETEQNHAGEVGGHSVWFEWAAGADGDVVIDTIGSRFDTLLAVYQGNSPGRLTMVSSDHGSVGSGGSRVVFRAVAGTKYSIALDGAGGASGSFTLNVRAPVEEPPLMISDPKVEDGTFRCVVPTLSGRTYTLEVKDRMSDQNWTDGHTMAGNGNRITLTNRCDALGGRFYRVRAE